MYLLTHGGEEGWDRGRGGPPSRLPRYDAVGCWWPGYLPSPKAECVHITHRPLKGRLSLTEEAGACP